MKRYILFFILLSPFSFVTAQDPSFSQFYANPLFVNPAFAGTAGSSRIVLGYRNQWPRIGTTFQTYSLSFDRMIYGTNAAWGVQLIKDQEPNNIVNTNQASASYSYYLKFNETSFMNFGLQAGIVLKQFEPGNLIFPSEIDQLSGSVSSELPIYNESEKKVFPDLGFGALYQYNEVYGGISLQHLNQPHESIIPGDQKGKLPVKATLHAGARLLRYHHGLLSRDFRLSPNLIYQQQGTFRQLSLGIYVVEKSFIFGGWYRNNIDIRPDALITMIGIANHWFRFGYSFDLTLSKLSYYSYGSHEISVTFLLAEPLKTTKHKLLIPII